MRDIIIGFVLGNMAVLIYNYFLFRHQKALRRRALAEEQLKRLEVK